MKRLLIIGAGSFTALHFIDLIRMRYPEEEWEIHGTQFHSSISGRNLRSCVELDITDGQGVEDFMQNLCPDYVINFAGWTNGSDPHMFYMVHGQGALNLLLAARKLVRMPRILMIGTATEYGPKDISRLPIMESEETFPITPYGHSKLMQTMICRQAAAEWDLPLLIVRPFNLLGPGMASHLAPAVFMTQIKKVKEKLSSEIRTGPLLAKRDYLDVRDAVDAYLKVLKEGVPGEVYNVCSGTSIPMYDLLSLMCEEAGMPDVPVISTGQGSKRSLSIDDSCGDNSKLRNELGWSLKFTLRETIRFMLDREMRLMESA
jgi:GDP-4-dehydro-6-deoxy-D-mannose reductase